MKPIKIEYGKKFQIETALADVNGKALAHTYTAYEEIELLADHAERELLSLLYKKDFAGAQWRETSGGKVANAYKNMRVATTVTIERRSESWYLIDVAHASIGVSGGGVGKLYLTEKQDAAAKAKLAERYLVRKVQHENA